MFRRLLFGNEAKLQFKTSTTHGIARLYSQANIPRSDVAYWNSFLTLFDSPSDVFSLLSVADVRKALVRHPENIATLVGVLAAHLETLKNDPYFSPKPSNNGQSDLTSSRRKDALAASQSIFDAGSRGAAALGSFLPALGTGASSSSSLNSVGASSESIRNETEKRDRLKEALNCCRILTRLLPIILEGDHDETSVTAAGDGVDQDPASARDDFERNLLWMPISDDDFFFEKLQSSNHAQKAEVDNQQEDSEQFVIEESDEDEEDKTPRQRSKAAFDPLVRAANEQTAEQKGASQESGPAPPTLGERLTKTIVDLLFYAGFTIPWTDEQLSTLSEASIASSRIQFVIWEKGVGSSLDLPGRTAAHEAHRAEVLRLLLALVSKTIYVPAHVQGQVDNRPLRHIAASLERSTVLPLLCSLLNVSVASSRNDNWLKGLANLPAGLVRDRTIPAEDVRVTTMALALQLLNVILGYERAADREVSASSGNSSECDSTMTAGRGTSSMRPQMDVSPLASSTGDSVSGREQERNLFRLYLGKLHRQSDFELLVDNIYAVLAQRANPVALLGAVASGTRGTETNGLADNVPDALILMWRLMVHNAKFRNYLLTERSPQLLSHLLFHALQNKDSLARQGLVRLIAFMLQDISCDRAFAVNICKAGSGIKATFAGSQRWGVGSANGSTGTATAQGSQVATGADVLIQGIYALVATTKSSLAALYPPLIITLTNISPYFRNIAILSANKLIALFRSFTSPSFLLADEGNPRLVYYLLECLNHVVMFGMQKNPNVIYALVRNHHLVEDLANFTLRKGIASIRRSHRRAGVVPSEDTPLSASQSDNNSESNGNAQEEKASVHGDGATPNLSGLSIGTHGIDDERPASEKARGKMRRHSNASEVDLTRQSENGESLNRNAEDEEDRLVNGFSEEELWYAASTIGRNGFVPTQSWVTSWHKGLPLDALQLTMLELVPKVQSMCASIASKSNADERVLAFLREQDLEGILPQAAANVHPRPFRWTPQVKIWLLSYVWGVIYVTTSMPYGLFNDTSVRLFQVRMQGPRRATVTNQSRSLANAGESGSPAPSTHASPRLFASADQAALGNVGNVVFGGLSQVFGIGDQGTRSTTRPETSRNDHSMERVRQPQTSANI